MPRAAGQREPSGVGEVPGQHRGTTHERGGNFGCHGDRVVHETGERALPQLAGEQRADERTFGRGEAITELRDDRGTPRFGAGPGALLQPGERVVEVTDRQRRGGRLARQRGRACPTHADPPLARRTRQPRDGDNDLVRVERTQQLRECRDLGLARRRRSERRGGCDQVGEQRHRSIDRLIIHIAAVSHPRDGNSGGDFAPLDTLHP